MPARSDFAAMLPCVKETHLRSPLEAAQLINHNRPEALQADALWLLSPQELIDCMRH